jgi:putative FmdB family regulatory protein
MITYEYECEACGHRFERRRAITDESLTECPKCQGKIFQRISGGSGFIVRAGIEKQSSREGGGCSFESSGRTCCGRDERCAEPPCQEES